MRKLIRNKKLLGVLVAMTGIFVAFQNFGIVSKRATVAELAAFAAGLQTKMTSNTFTPGAVRFLGAHKVLADNLIATKTHAQTCAQLLASEPTLTTGVYTLFPRGLPDAPASLYCATNNGKLTKEGPPHYGCMGRHAGGFCWYPMSTAGEACSTTCNDHGGRLPADVGFIGNAKTVKFCSCADGYNPVLHGDDSVVFDAAWYLKNNPDLQKAFGASNTAAARNHWVTTGMAEGRQGSSTFSATSYLSLNSDLNPKGAKKYYYATMHYYLFGLDAGRPVFSTTGTTSSTATNGTSTATIGAASTSTGTTATSTGTTVTRTSIYRFTDNKGLNQYQSATSPSPSSAVTLANSTPAFTVYATQVTGSVALQRCQQGTARFLSVDSKCEGSTVAPAGPLGFISKTSTAGTVPLYRDRSADWSKSIETLDSTLYFTNQDILGYVPTSNTVQLPTSTTTTVPPAAGTTTPAVAASSTTGTATVGVTEARTNIYRFTDSNGLNVYTSTSSPSPSAALTLFSSNPVFTVFTTQVPGSVALQRCQQGTARFLSVSANCEGSTVAPAGPIGFIMTAPLGGTAPLYRDRSTDWTKSVETLDSKVYFTRQDILGYVPVSNTIQFPAVANGLIQAGVPISCTYFSPTAIGSLSTATIQWLATIKPSGLTLQEMFLVARQVGYSGTLGDNGLNTWLAQGSNQTTYNNAVSAMANASTPPWATRKAHNSDRRAAGYQGLFLCGGDACWTNGQCDSFGRQK